MIWERWERKEERQREPSVDASDTMLQQGVMVLFNYHLPFALVQIFRFSLKSPPVGRRIKIFTESLDSSSVCWHAGVTFSSRRVPRFVMGQVWQR